MRADVKALGDAVIASVKGYVASAVASLSERFAELDARLGAIPAGPQGERGDKGDRGERGEQGAPGIAPSWDKLLPVVREFVVDAAASFPAPKDGQDGAPGPAGATGKDGEKGEKGDAGERGEPGPMGPAGPPGEAGADGREGEPGAAGRDGKDGASGKDGRDGEPGAPGRDGLDGKDGAPGQHGADGEPGRQGPPGLDGEKGVDGRDGKDGRDGRDGKDGSPGRDALEIEILPAIDESRTYPRGTFAQFAGGLVRAVRNTDAINDCEGASAAGWAFIVRGIASVDVQQAHERSFEFAISYSDGAVDRKTFSTPVMIWRGIFREGAYERGDTVTWGGSLWHCEVPTTDKPGTSTAWKLCAKSGRDGKDFTRIDKG